MAEDGQIIERTLSITNSCILPELLEDFDAKPISSEDFREYKLIANENLFLLLDILHQNRYILTDKAYDSQLIQLRLNLIVIVCEQFEFNSFFHSDDKILLQNLRKIVFDHIQTFEDLVFTKCIELYKNKLKKNIWKRQFGKIHSCPMLCETFLLYKPFLIDDDNLMFFLYVGSNLIAHFEPHYKTIGLKIYRRLVEHCDRDQLKKLNIHSVIFCEIFPLIQREKEIAFNDHLYECLYQIVSLENSHITNSRWCKYDDVMSKLLSQFSFESESNLCKFLVHQIVRFCGIGYLNFKLKSLENVTDLEDYFSELKSLFNQPNNRVSRWIKKLMELMIRESTKLLICADVSLIFINAFHMIYIMTIFTMEPASFHQTLIDFTKKFIIIQMKIVKTFKNNQKILKSVLFLLSTIEQHQYENKQLIVSLEKIRQHEMFKI